MSIDNIKYELFEKKALGIIASALIEEHGLQEEYNDFARKFIAKQTSLLRKNET